MASAVFSTSAATLIKRNHLTCLIGEKQVEHVAWREGKNLIKLWSSRETRLMFPLIPLKWKYLKYSQNLLPHAACQNNFPDSLVDLIKPIHVSRTITRCYMRKSNQHSLNFWNVDVCSITRKVGKILLLNQPLLFYAVFNNNGMSGKVLLK